MHRLKFAEDLIAGAVLADVLAGAVEERGGPVDAIVPVPMPAARIRARGFNQACVLSTALARRLRIAHRPRLCERSGMPAPQREMSDAAARRRNVRGTFAVRRGRCPASVAIVDDVMTTGSTVTALATCLRAAGAATVEVWAVARGGSGVEVGH